MNHPPVPHLLLLALCSGLLTAADDPVQHMTFIGPAQGEWITGTNWDTNSSPTPNDIVTIPSGKIVTISTNDPVCADLTIDGTLRFLTDGSLEITPGSTVTINGTLSVEGTNISLRQTTAADADNPALTVTVASGGFLKLGTEAGGNGELTLERGINLVNDGTMALYQNGSILAKENALNALILQGQVDWTMNTRIAILLRDGGTATLGGSLTGQRATNYLTREDEEAILLEGTITSGSDFATATVPGFTRQNSSAKVSFTSDANTGTTNTVTITTTNPAAPRYGDVLQLTATATNTAGTVSWSGLPSDKIAISGTTARLIGIGTGATIQATMAAQGGYYADSDNIALNEILPAQVTVTINGGTRQVGQTNPTPTLSINGLVNGDTAAKLGNPSYTGEGTSANASTPEGSYAITATFPDASPNYHIEVIPGHLVVTAIPISSGPPTTGSSGGGGGGCGVGGGLGLLAAGALFLRRRQK